MKYSIIIFATAALSAYVSADGNGQWVAGESGSTCDATCTSLDENASCDSDMQSSITSVELIESAFAEAGYTCLSAKEENHRDYAGAPFHTGRDGDDCYFVSPGGTSVCDDNEYDDHVPLCYCQMPVDDTTIDDSITTPDDGADQASDTESENNDNTQTIVSITTLSSSENTALNGRIDVVDDKVDTVASAVDTLETDLTSADTALSERIDDVDGRVDTVDGRVDTVDGRADTLESDLQALSDRMDLCEARLSSIETAPIESAPIESVQTYDSGPDVELIPVQGADPLFYIDIADNMEFSMDIIINSFPSDGGASIFQCGASNPPNINMPIILVRSTGELEVSFSTDYSISITSHVRQYLTPILATGTNYKLEIKVTQDTIQVFVNGDIVIDESLNEHALYLDKPCYVGKDNSWDVADVVIKNLLVTSGDDSVSAHSVSGFAAKYTGNYGLGHRGYAKSIAATVDDTNAISTTNEHLLQMIYALVILNVVTIVGCVCCLLWMNNRMLATKGYQGVVYSEEDVNINA